jgi:hypothetical protein
MPDGSFYLMGHDVFMPYVLAVVVLWTTLRGPRTGVVLLAGVAVLELVMGLVNGIPLDAVGWPEFLNRFATACLAVALPLVVMAAARRGGRLQAAEGLRAGRETERARLLAATHERALHTLETIVTRADAGDDSPMVRVRELQALARGQAAELRAILQADHDRALGGLAAGLRALAGQSRRDGVAVELVSSQLRTEPGSAAGAALLEATHQALLWVAAAEARRVVIRAISRPDGVQVTVRGHGDDRPEGPAEPSDRIGQELRRVGGRVETWSAPGRGARVTLWAPA